MDLLGKIVDAGQEMFDTNSTQAQHKPQRHEGAGKHAAAGAAAVHAAAQPQSGSCAAQGHAGGPHAAHGGADGLIWKGDCCGDWRKVFNNMNYEGAEKHSKGEGKIRVVEDEAGRQCWRVAKPACDKRAEIRGCQGYQQQEGEEYYLGWRWRITMPATKLGHHGEHHGVTVFQWKSYGEGITQNYPFNIDYDGETLVMTTFAPGWEQGERAQKVQQVWEKAAAAGDWVTFVVGIGLSSDAAQGFIELWVDGEQQTFKDGSTRIAHKTNDGSETAPKWGIYNKEGVGHDIHVDLRDMCVGRNLKAVQAELPQE